MKIHAAALFVVGTLSIVACSGDDSSSTSSTPASASSEVATESSAATQDSPTSVVSTDVATTVASASLPIGDGKVSATEAKVGWVYSCGIPQGGGGAFADGPWIDAANGTWDPSQKVNVGGSVTWPYKFSFELQGDSRAIDTNDLPSHPTGVFPISPSEPAYSYDRNPNSIAEQSVSWTLPANPAKADTPSCLNMGAIGVMTTGSVLFNALDAEGRDAAAHETLDNCDGHPERTGEYHYHNLSTCNPAYGADEPALVGWAADGFPIVTGKIDGRDATNADLDECHGRETTVAIDGAATTTYAYWMTAEYPYSLGCFWGTEVASKG